MRADLGQRDGAHRHGRRLRLAAGGAGPAGVGRRRDLPCRHCSDVTLGRQGEPRFRPGHHPRLCPPGQCVGTCSDGRRDGGVWLARVVLRLRRHQFCLGGAVGTGVHRATQGSPAHDPGGTRRPAPAQAEEHPQVALGTAVPAHGAGHRRLLLLRLDPVAAAELGADVLHEHGPGPEEHCHLRLHRVLRRRGGRYPGRHRQRPHTSAPATSTAPAA